MTSKSATTLILGGARSGKSQRAQQLVEDCPGNRIFIATAEARDAEMTERIAHHAAARGDDWQTIEAPLLLAEAIERACSPDAAVLVDCLTLWLSNVMQTGRDVNEELHHLVMLIAHIDTPLVLVSNEVGMGIVPKSALGREFRDAQGRLNQRMAAVCDQVEFIAAGLPLRLKG